MKLFKGDIWSLDNHAIGIPTNGFIKKNGEAVMGACLAHQAKKRYPSLPKKLGSHIKAYGHSMTVIQSTPKMLLSIPVKPQTIHITEFHQFKKVLPKFRPMFRVGDKVPGYCCFADTELIKQSLLDLIEWVCDNSPIEVAIPLLGRGNGGLSVKKELHPIIKQMITPDQITLVFPNEHNSQ